jgi:uncharacterized delta-60 repeat protein
LGSPAIFNGPFVKLLKDQLRFGNTARILTGNIDPRVVATEAESGSLYLQQGTPGTLYIKLDEGETTNWAKISEPNYTAPMIDGGTDEPISGFQVDSTETRSVKTEYSAFREYNTIQSLGLEDNYQFNDFFQNAISSDKLDVTSAESSVGAIGVDSSDQIMLSSNYGDVFFPAFRFDNDSKFDASFFANTEKKFNAIIRSISTQSDGKILVGGQFTNYPGGTNRNRLIRLNADGTVDDAFCANASDGVTPKFSNAIRAIAVQSDGKILVGGSFTGYPGGTNRNYLIRLNADGTVDDAFCVNASDGGKFNGTIYTIAVQSDGKILVGGFFTNYPGGTNRNRLIRLNADGTTDGAFCVNASDGVIPKFDSLVQAIVVQSDGKILVGGSFTGYPGGTNRNRLIRLNADGTTDSAFCVNASDGVIPKFSSATLAIVVQSDGKILVGGAFSGYPGGTNRNYLIRLNADGTVDGAFCANASDGGKFTGEVSHIIIKSTGDIVVGGLFTNWNGNTRISRWVALNSDGTLNTAAHFDSKFNLAIYSTKIQSDGKILVGGNFTNYGGTTGRNRLIRLNADGTVDGAFCANASDGGKFTGAVRTIAIQSDGKILVGGQFTNYPGATSRNHLMRLNADGTVDDAFCANTVDLDQVNSPVYAIATQSDGKILLGGSFDFYSGVPGREYFARLNADGTVDNAFCINASDGAKFTGAVRTIAIQSDGKILVGGNFAGYPGGTNRNHLIRLNADGTVDNAFCINASDGITPRFSAQVFAIAIQSDGKILVGGNFAGYPGGTNRNHLIRLNADGTVDGAFCANASDGSRFSSAIWCINIQSDELILIGGDFMNYPGSTNRNHLIRLNADGTTDNAFCVNASDYNKFNDTVETIALRSNNQIIVGGSFTNYINADASRLTQLESNGSNSIYYTSIRDYMFSSELLTVKIDNNGGLLCGGNFIDYNKFTNRNRFIRINSDGALDTAFCANASDGGKFNGRVWAIVVQSDGKILVGGSFTGYPGGTNRNRLIRLNADGTVDDAFCANASDGLTPKFNGDVEAIVVQSDGKILVGGLFTNYANTTNRNRLIRLNADGTVDDAFCANASDGVTPKFSSTIYTIEVQSDGKILVGGNFTNYGGTTGRNRLIRLNADGTVDGAFCANASDGVTPKFSSTIYTIEVQNDGKILVGGDFTSYANTTNRNRLIRLNADGTTDSAFCVNASDGAKFSNRVYTIAVQSDDKILVGGDFTSYSGVLGRDRFIRLNSGGTVDTIFCNTIVDSKRFTSSVRTIAQKEYIGGLTVFVGGNSFWHSSDGLILPRLMSFQELYSIIEECERGSFYLTHIYNTNTWRLGGRSFTGDDLSLDFSVDSTGQIYYTIDPVPGILNYQDFKWTKTDL